MRTILGLLFCCFGLSAFGAGQGPESPPADRLRSPGWNYGIQISGGASVLEVSSPVFPTAGRTTSNVSLMLHTGRVLTHEHGHGWLAGTLEIDAGIVPAELFFVLGTHYAGGFEAPEFRWNFTHNRRRFVPFVSAGFGMLFSPENFPPGDTLQYNFTAAADVGAHVFLRRRQSLDVTARVHHLSNAYLGPLNPGVPVSLQLTLGYTWFGRK